MKLPRLATAFAAIAAAALVAAQEGPPDRLRPNRPGGNRPERPDRDRFGPRPDRFGRNRLRPGRPTAPSYAMEVEGKFAYVVIGTHVFKIRLEDMSVAAEKDLTEDGGAEGSLAKDFIAKLDKDGDGKISREEWRGPGEWFDRLDRDGDGAVSEEEVPEELLKRFARKAKPAGGGPALIRFAGEHVLVMVGTTVYKLQKSDLSLVGITDLKPKKKERPRKPEPAPEPGKTEPKKKGDDDFGF